MKKKRLELPRAGHVALPLRGKFVNADEIYYARVNKEKLIRVRKLIGIRDELRTRLARAERVLEDNLRSF